MASQCQINLCCRWVRTSAPGLFAGMFSLHEVTLKKETYIRKYKNKANYFITVAITQSITIISSESPLHFICPILYQFGSLHLDASVSKSIFFKGPNYLRHSVPVITFNLSQRIFKISGYIRRMSISSRCMMVQLHCLKQGSNQHSIYAVPNRHTITKQFRYNVLCKILILDFLLKKCDLSLIFVLWFFSRQKKIENFLCEGLKLLKPFREINVPISTTISGSKFRKRIWILIQHFKFNLMQINAHPDPHPRLNKKFLLSVLLNLSDPNFFQDQFLV